MSFAEKVLQYYSQLTPPTKLPLDIQVLNPYLETSTMQLATAFYKKYYDDSNERYMCFGINPGRFGAGVTGVPFTDPIRLENNCGITNELSKRPELSSRFIYDMIATYGTVSEFFDTFYISAVSPLGYVHNGININYYDVKNYKAIFYDYAIDQIELQLEFGISKRIAFSIGRGKNMDFLSNLNKERNYFNQIVALPHPRWVMQYRLKKKDEFIQEYMKAFAQIS